jgi:hypothetical protein
MSPKNREAPTSPSPAGRGVVTRFRIYTSLVSEVIYHV